MMAEQEQIHPYIQREAEGEREGGKVDLTYSGKYVHVHVKKFTLAQLKTTLTNFS